MIPFYFGEKKCAEKRVKVRLMNNSLSKKKILIVVLIASFFLS